MTKFFAAGARHVFLPAALVDDHEQEGRSEYLSLLLVMLAAVAFIAFMVTLLFGTESTGMPAVLMSSSALAIASALLIRSRWARLGEHLGLACLVFAAVGLLATNPRPAQLPIVVFPVFYVSLYVRPIRTLAFSLLGCATALVGFLTLEPARLREGLLALGTVVAICAVIYLQTHLLHRSRRSLQEQNTRLRESELRFRGAVEGSLDAFMLMRQHHDDAGNVVDAEVVVANERAAQMMRLPREKLIGERLAMVGARATAHPLYEIATQRISADPAVVTDYETSDGHFYSVQRVRVGDLVAVTLKDVTEKRRTTQVEREVEQLAMQLGKEREMNDLRATLMATISHEFRTPLTVIMNNAEILDRYYARLTDQQREERILGIKDHVVQLRAMLENIALIVRGSSNRLPFNPQETDLGLYMHTLFYQLCEQARDTHRFSYEPIGDLRHTVVDVTLLHQIVTNLMTNAIKFTPAGGSVALRIQGGDDMLTFTITDTGIGIPEADLPRIYEPFHRADNIGEVRGTGLGLSIVRECVLRHGGTLQVASHLAQGTAFTVQIPRRPPNTSPLAAEAAAGQTP